MGDERKLDKLVLVGMAIASLGLLIGAYVAFAIAPEADYLWELDGKTPLQRTRAYELHDLKVNLGTAAMGLGGLGFLLSIKSALSTKHPVAFAALADGLIAFLLGAAYGTHMFS